MYPWLVADAHRILCRGGVILGSKNEVERVTSYHNGLS